MKFGELNIREKIGQTLIVGLDIPKGKHMYDVIDKIVSEYKAGGICLYKKNYDTLLEHEKESAKKIAIKKSGLEKQEIKNYLVD